MRVLVTGGAGFIGSNTCVSLLGAGHDVVILDNLCNSQKSAIDAIEAVSGRKVAFYPWDLCQEERAKAVFEREEIDAVIHFAGLKAVGESVARPLLYYQNNLISTLNLVAAMESVGVKKLVFSSSATVYGDPETVPITEEFSCGATNPYGATKLMQERILTDIQKASPELGIALLRYFNPVGGHASGLLSESPKGIPNNLMPYIVKVAEGEMPFLRVFGDDYKTPDGTGVRDYIHVTDLAEGHVAALKKLSEKNGLFVYNLGTGNGYSVLELVSAFEKSHGVEIPYKIVERRPGDIAICYADVRKSEDELAWKAKRSLEDMCKDAWSVKNRRNK